MTGALKVRTSTSPDVWTTIAGGVTTFASDAEVVAGVETSKAVSPAGLASTATYFDPRRYGAVGDGDADDTAAVQAAVTAAAVAGGQVRFAGGTYIVGNIVCPTSVSLTGTGQATTIVKAKAGTTGNWFQFHGYAEVSHLWFDANACNVTALYLYQSARSMVHHVYLSNGGATSTAIRAEGTAPAAASHANKYSDINIIGFGAYGIVLHNYAYDSELVNVWVGTCGVGIWCYTGAQQLTGCHIWGCTGDGLLLSGGDLSRITNCYLESNGGYGLHAQTTGRGFWISNSQIWANLTGGVWIDGGQNGRVVDCTVYDNVGPGIKIDNHLTAIISANHLFNYTGTPQTYGVQETGTTNSSTIIGNVALDSNHSSGVGLSILGALTMTFGNRTTASRDVSLVQPLAGQASTAVIAAPAGQNRTLAFSSGTSQRWLLQTNVTAESGSNVGSDFVINSRTDAGASLAFPFFITRSTGQVNIGNGLTMADGKDIVLGTGTGTKFGTAASAKLGFYGATPIVRATVPAAATDAATTQTLVNALRTALINLGLVS